jgi:DUF1707 SHOCT-like domain
MPAPADFQRERTVAVLKRAYAEGRLELEEFAERAERALETRSPWELRFQLRGLMVDDVRRRALVAARIAAIVLAWTFLSVFLAIGFVVALIATSASIWTLAFPAVWVVFSVLAVRQARRATG